MEVDNCDNSYGKIDPLSGETPSFSKSHEDKAANFILS